MNFLLLMLAFLSFLFLSSHTFAQKNTEIVKPSPASGSISHVLKVTATVPVSDVWEKAIRENAESNITQIQPAGQATTFSVTIRGVQNEIMNNQRVNAVITNSKHDHVVIKAQSDTDSIVRYSFTPDKSGDYLVQFIDETYDFDKAILLNTKLHLSIPE